MINAIITGTFDPITVGHIDLLKKSISLFGDTAVVILDNCEKKTMFTWEERLEICNAAIKDIPGASAVVKTGLTSDAAHDLGAKILVRGARNATDFDYEYGLSNIMKRFDPDLETVILPAAPELSMISSTYVRELIKYGCSLSGSVPDECIPVIEKSKKQ